VPERKKIGLALGGGGARGIAHLGVLYTLEKFGIPIDMISGTSIGSVIAAMYAQHQDSRYISDKFFEAQKSPEYKALQLDRIAYNARRVSHFESIKGSFINYALHKRMGLLKGELTENFLRHLFGDTRFSDLKMPIALIAGNITQFKGVSFRGGDLIKAVQASMSLPMWMEPVEIDGDLYVDGITQDVVPTQILKEMGADIIIAVDISLRDKPKKIRHALDVDTISSAMTVNRSIDLSLEFADIIIKPETNDLKWYDFDRSPELIRSGREATKIMIPEINKLL
jgi:NTE family protein